MKDFIAGCFLVMLGLLGLILFRWTCVGLFILIAAHCYGG